MSITDFFKRLFKIEDQDYLDLLEEIRAGLADHSLDYFMIHFICNAPQLPHWKTLIDAGSFPLDKATLSGRLGRYVKAGYSPYEKLADALKEAQEWAKTPEGEAFYEEQKRKRLEALDAKNPPRKAIRLIKTAEWHVSKLGGRPNLPEGIPWPKNPEGGELDFLAQIHFPEIPVGLGLPKTGTLFVFYDNELMPWGNEEKDVNYWKIIYTEEPSPDAVRNRTPSDKECYEFNEAFLTFEVFLSKASDVANSKSILNLPERDLKNSSGTPYAGNNERRIMQFKIKSDRTHPQERDSEWLAYVIAAFLLQVMGLDWRLRI